MKKFFLIVLAIALFAVFAVADTATQAGPYLPLNAKAASTVAGKVSFKQLTSVENIAGNTAYQMLSGTAGTKVKNIMVQGTGTILSTGAALTVTMPFTATTGSLYSVFVSNMTSSVSPTSATKLTTSTFSISGPPSTVVDYLIVGR